MIALLLLLAQDVDRLAADDPAERAAAREQVRKTADREALLRALKVRETRAAAALALGVLGAAEAKDALVSTAKERDPAARARALEAMGFLPEPPVEPLFDALGDGDARAAFAAARSLGRCAEKKVRPRLWAIYSSLLGARKREVRFLAASLALEGLSPGAQWHTFWASAADADPAYAGAALLGLLQVEKLDPAGVDFTAGFRAALARTDLKEDARAIAATLWVRLGGPSREDLFSLLRDREEPTRRVARSALDAAALTKLDDWSEAKLRAITGFVPQEKDRAREWRAWWERNRETAIAESVARAVARGVARLRNEAQADGTWKDRHGQAGLTALAAYTLLKCGVPASELAKPLDFVAKAPFDGPALEGGTYRTACIAMAMAEAASVAGEKYRRRAIEAAEHLVKTQRRSGGWGYGEADASYHDTSNAQFAVLGLRAAQNVGATVAAATWSRAASHLASCQMGDGGWAYVKEQSYGSMTAAGLCALLTARASGKGKPAADFLRDKEVAAALEWLQKNWSMEGHRYRTGGVGSGIGSAYYWLWTVERCALAADVRQIGAHDWWFEGTAHIVGRQGKDGEWTGPEGPAAHCFALLFLRRAHVPVATGPQKED